MSAIDLSWMLTYLLHSTLLLGGAWLAWKLLPSEALAVKETLWRTALLGGIVTASLQAGLAVEPGLGSWRLGVAEPDAVGSQVAVASSTAEAVPVGDATPAPRQTTSALPSIDPSRYGLVPAAGGSTGFLDEDTAAGTAVLAAWGRRGLTVWAIGAFAMVGWLAVSCLVLAGRLVGRWAIADGRLHAILIRLRTTTRMTDVVLSASARIGSPMAFGWRRREICLPERVVSEMAAEQQELILAHELAHHARRDPVWLLAGRLIECVLFFQPLNRVACRRLQEIAEYRCDDWAVERTGRPITLARCLADVAEWNLRRGAPLPVPTLAVERGRLGRRVARLLDRGYPFPAAGRPRWLATGVTLTLVLVVLLAPGVSSGHAPLAPGAPGALGAPDALEVSEVPEIPEAVPVPPVPVVQAEPPVPIVQAEPPSPVVQAEPPVPVVQTEPPSPIVAPTPPSLVMTAPTPVLPPSPPGPPGAQVAPVEIPASPPPADHGNGGWMLHDHPWLVFPSGPRAELDRLRALRAKLEERRVAKWEEVARLRDEVRRRMEASRSDREELARLREALRHHVEERRLELNRVRMLEDARAARVGGRA